MAEAYFRHLCDRDGNDGIGVASAGVHAMDGGEASAMGIAALRHEGIVLTGFRSSALSAAQVDAAADIIVMTAGHCRQVLSMYPHVTDKTRQLMGYSGSNADVFDPYGGDLDMFQQCLAMMKPALIALYRDVKSQLE